MVMSNKDNKDKFQYEDIIHLQHHVSSHHEHMSLIDRAAQFSPFAALTGFDGEIKETARLTDKRMELAADAREILNEKLRIVREQLNNKMEVEFTFYQPDEMKSGGAYVSVRGLVKKIDEYEHVVVMQDGTRISVEDIVAITGEMFRGADEI
jgi:methanogenic corrinoid protein MtbC1